MISRFLFPSHPVLSCFSTSSFRFVHSINKVGWSDFTLNATINVSNHMLHDTIHQMHYSELSYNVVNSVPFAVHSTFECVLSHVNFRFTQMHFRISGKLIKREAQLNCNWIETFITSTPHSIYIFFIEISYSWCSFFRVFNVYSLFDRVSSLKICRNSPLYLLHFQLLYLHHFHRVWMRVHVLVRMFVSLHSERDEQTHTYSCMTYDSTYSLIE